MALKKILLVGGGSGGHLLPLIPLIEALVEKGTKVHLVVNDAPLDHQIVSDNLHHFSAENLQIHFLRCGKLRAYLSFKNITDLWQIFHSCFRSRALLRSVNPEIILAKGGFVGFPILLAWCTASWRKKVPLVLHESDISDGALTRLFGSVATAVWRNFENHPLFFTANKKNTQKTLLPSPKKLPQLLVLGGSQGSLFLNQLVDFSAEKLVSQFEVTLITGPNRLSDLSSSTQKKVTAFPLLPAQEFDERLASADLVLSRGGAILWQIAAARVPALVVPLPRSARDHQLLGAQEFAQRGWCRVVTEAQISAENIVAELQETLQQSAQIKASLKNTPHTPPVEKMIKQLEKMVSLSH